MGLNTSPQGRNSLAGDDPLVKESVCLSRHDCRMPEMDCIVDCSTGIKMQAQSRRPHVLAKSPTETESYLISVGEFFCEVWQVPTKDRELATLVFGLFVEWRSSKGWQARDYQSPSKSDYLIRWPDSDRSKIVPDFIIEIFFKDQLLIKLWRSQ